MIIVGVDNGLDGGLAALSSHSGDLIDRIKMPTKRVGKKREVDSYAVYRWLSDLHSPYVLAIEEPLPHAKSSQAVRSMALSFGKLLGMAETRLQDVVRVPVREWQKAMLGKVPRGETKAFALREATRLHPDENWLGSDRSKKPHDGIIDAYLIARHHWERL
jgi:hypothetical protein